MHFKNLVLLSASLATAQGYVAPRKFGNSDSNSDSNFESVSFNGPSSGSPSCVKDDCYNSVFSRRDNGFCSSFVSPRSCDLPSDLSRYSNRKDSVKSACNCYLQQSTATSSAPATSPTSGSPSCVKDDCYNSVFGRNDNGFCASFVSPRSCDLPSDLSRYSNRKDNVKSACNCYLQQSTATNSAPETSQTSGSPSCVKDDCYNSVFNRNDNGFCSSFVSPRSCDLPSDLSRYSNQKDSVKSACNCYLQQSTPTNTQTSPANTQASPTSTGSASCVKDDCYNDIFGRRDNGFCAQFNSPRSCDLPSDLSHYSNRKDSVKSACNCYLQQSTPTNAQTSPANTQASPTSTGSASCVKDDCYNDIFGRRDNGFCAQFNSPRSCDLPSDLSHYSNRKDSVKSACNCYLQQSTQTSNQAPPTNTQASPTNTQTSPANTQASPTNTQTSPANTQASPTSNQAPPTNTQVSPTSNQGSPTSTGGPSSCVRDSCYNDVFNRNDNGFCGRFNSPSSCDLPSDLSHYSNRRESVRSACNCYLQQSTPTSNQGSPTSTGGPSSCVRDSCYNDIFNRNDNGFCGKFNSPNSCDLPSDLSHYSNRKDSVRSACNCYLQQNTQSSYGPTSTNNGPATVTDFITTNGPSQTDYVTVNGPVSDYTVDYTVTVSASQQPHTVTVTGSAQPAQTVTVSGSAQPAHTVTVSGSAQPAHTVTVSGSAQPAHTVTVSGSAQPAQTVTVSGSAQPAHTITISAPATKTCPSASTIHSTCTVTKTASATCSSRPASTVTKTASGATCSSQHPASVVTKTVTASAHAATSK